jgi:hypothetical protein
VSGVYFPLDIEQDRKGSMEKTSRDIEIDPNKFAIWSGRDV